MENDVVEAKLREKSSELNISLEELVNRYVRRGLYCDDYYNPPKLTREELIEISKMESEKDRKRGIPPKKHNFDVFVGLINNSDD